MNDEWLGFPGGASGKKKKKKKNLLVQETYKTRVQSLDQEDALEEGMATRSSIHAWRIPWAEEPCKLQSIGLQRAKHDWVT